VAFVVPAWLGHEYAASGIVAALLVVGYGINTGTAPLSCLVRAIGRPGLETRYGIAAMVLNVVATVPLAARFGLFGVATGTAVGTIIGSLAFPVIVRRGLPPLRRSRLVLPEMWVRGAVAGVVTLAIELLARRVHAVGATELFAVSIGPAVVVAAVLLTANARRRGRRTRPFGHPLSSAGNAR
jgi:O-antigen/teichoic acid export membrane protein